jgi:hypothetical protein
VTQPPVGAKPDGENGSRVETECQERQRLHGASGVVGPRCGLTGVLVRRGALPVARHGTPHSRARRRSDSTARWEEW